MPRLKLSEKPGEDGLIYYKPWARAREIREIFSVGQLQLDEWRKNGWVLCQKKGGNIAYRCKDIDNVMTRLAMGMTPVRARG